MATEVRSRSRFQSTQIGTYSYLGTLAGTRTRQSPWEGITDVIGDYGGDHTLLHRKFHRTSGALNGSNGFYSFDNWLLNTPYLYPDAEMFSAAELATELASRTNPSRPSVQLPVFVSELRDLPRLVLLAGRGLLKKGASANLSYQFGWKPLLSDLNKMLRFTAIVDQRVRELENLGKKGGLRRKLPLGNISNTTVGTQEAINSSPSVSLTYGIPTTVTEREAWGTIRWVPNAQQYPSNSAARRKLATTYLKGLHPSQMASNLWEALPWTWLVDWFTTAGSFLQASNNSIAKQHGMINIMVKSTVTRTWEVTSKQSWITVNPTSPEQKTEYKERFLQSGPSLVGKVPFLTGRQLSILGSLAILRSR